MMKIFNDPKIREMQKFNVYVICKQGMSKIKTKK